MTTNVFRCTELAGDAFRLVGSRVKHWTPELLVTLALSFGLRIVLTTYFDLAGLVDYVHLVPLASLLGFVYRSIPEHEHLRGSALDLRLGRVEMSLLAVLLLWHSPGPLYSGLEKIVPSSSSGLGVVFALTWAVGSFYLGGRLSLCLPAVGTGGSLAEGWHLSKGSAWPLFVVLVLIGLATTLPLLLAFLSLGLVLNLDSLSASKILDTSEGVVSVSVALLVWLVSSVAFWLIYEDLQRTEETEGVDPAQDSLNTTVPAGLLRSRQQPQK